MYNKQPNSLISGRWFRPKLGYLCTGILIFSLLISKNLYAEIDWHINGFGTIAGGYLEDEDINEANASPYNEFERGAQYDIDSKFALQGGVNFDEAWAITAQAVALGPDDYDPEIEWAYLSWQLNQQFIIRAGKLRRPNYLFSDTLRVGYTYPWIRPPVEVYSRDLQLFSEVDAVNLLYNWSAGAWNYELEGYIGESDGRAEIVADDNLAFTTKHDIGLILTMEKDWLTLRFAYQRLPHADIENSNLIKPLYSALESAGFSDIVAEMQTDDIEAEFFNLAVGVDYQDWLANFEFIHVPVERSIAVDETSWYLMAGRRFGSYTLHYTYAERERENDDHFSDPIRVQADQVAPFDPVAAATLNVLADSVDLAAQQSVIDINSHTIGLRYDFATPIAIKAEYQLIEDNLNDLDTRLFSVAMDFFF